MVFAYIYKAIISYHKSVEIKPLKFQNQLLCLGRAKILKFFEFGNLRGSGIE